MIIDLEKIVNGLVASFIGGWWSWITFGHLKLKKDMDAAHRKLRGEKNVANNNRTSNYEGNNTKFTEID